MLACLVPAARCVLPVVRHQQMVARHRAFEVARRQTCFPCTWAAGARDGPLLLPRGCVTRGTPDASRARARLRDRCVLRDHARGTVRLSTEYSSCDRRDFRAGRCAARYLHRSWIDLVLRPAAREATGSCRGAPDTRGRRPVRPRLETLLRRGWFEGLTIDVPGWDEHRTTLAAALSKDGWDELADAITGVRNVQVMLNELLFLGNGEIDPAAIPPDGRDVVEHAITTLRRANAVLERIA